MGTQPLHSLSTEEGTPRAVAGDDGAVGVDGGTKGTDDDRMGRRALTTAAAKAASSGDAIISEWPGDTPTLQAERSAARKVARVTTRQRGLQEPTDPETPTDPASPTSAPVGKALNLLLVVEVGELTKADAEADAVLMTNRLTAAALAAKLTAAGVSFADGDAGVTLSAAPSAVDNPATAAGVIVGADGRSAVRAWLEDFWAPVDLYGWEAWAAWGGLLALVVIAVALLIWTIQAAKKKRRAHDEQTKREEEARAADMANKAAARLAGGAAGRSAAGSRAESRRPSDGGGGGGGRGVQWRDDPNDRDRAPVGPDDADDDDAWARGGGGARWEGTATTRPVSGARSGRPSARRPSYAASSARGESGWGSATEDQGPPGRAGGRLSRLGGVSGHERSGSRAPSVFGGGDPADGFDSSGAERGVGTGDSVLTAADLQPTLV